ncbi:hypothetical protein ACFQ0B_14335 [Nonomuraea thailandensis]
MLKTAAACLALATVLVAAPAQAATPTLAPARLPPSSSRTLTP